MSVLYKVSKFIDKVTSKEFWVNELETAYWGLFDSSIVICVLVAMLGMFLKMMRLEFGNELVKWSVAIFIIVNIMNAVLMVK